MIDPISTETATVATQWLWKNYGKKILDGATSTVKSKWNRFSWSEREAKYAKRLLEEHSTTKLLGHPKEIRLDQIFTDVYVLDKISAFQRLGLEVLKKKEFNRKGRVAPAHRKPLLDIAVRTHRLFLLGKPGAGKSTFMKSVVRLCCEGKIAKTAIFVPLKRWSDTGKTLDEFIIREFEICDFPDPAPFVKELLKNGGAIVLCDGLDEIPNTGNARKLAIDSISDFSRLYNKSQMILTCRTAATEYSFEKFTYVEIADFTYTQQRVFISKWYSDSPTIKKRLLAEWEDAGNEDLVDLARTPLLLALLCLAYDDTLTFPRRRIELYEEAVTALLRKWDSSRGIVRDEVYRGLSHNRKEQMLRRVALESFQKAVLLIPKRVLVDAIEEYLRELPLDDVKQGIDGEAVLRAVEAQHGLLVERADDIYSFSHLTVHEYFAAKKIIESSKTDVIVDLMRTHAMDDQWREIILMVASMLDDGRFLLDALVSVMKELADSHSGIREFINAVLASRSASRHSEGPYLSKKNPSLPRGPVSAFDIHRVTHLSGELAVISDCCSSILLNTKGIGKNNQFLTLPRLILAVLEKDNLFAHSYFGGSSDSVGAARTFFRLAALVTECLTLTALPNREDYVDVLFRPLNV